MTRHYGKLVEYVTAVSRDYGKGDKFLAALQEDITQYGSHLGVNLMTRGFGALHTGVDKLAEIGAAKVGEFIAGLGRPKRPIPR